MKTQQKILLHAIRKNNARRNEDTESIQIEGDFGFAGWGVVVKLHSKCENIPKIGTLPNTRKLHTTKGATDAEPKINQRDQKLTQFYLKTSKKLILQKLFLFNPLSRMIKTKVIENERNRMEKRHKVIS